MYQRRILFALSNCHIDLHSKSPMYTECPATDMERVRSCQVRRHVIEPYKHILCVYNACSHMIRTSFFGHLVLPVVFCRSGYKIDFRLVLGISPERNGLSHDLVP